VGVLVGAISTPQARPVLERFFGRKKGEGKPPKPAFKSFAFQGERRKSVSFQAEPYLAIAFYKPPAPAREDYVFDMLDGLLCEGRTGRLYRQLVQQLKWAANVSCTASFPGSRQENLFIVFVTPNKGHSLKKLEEKVTEELNKLKKEVRETELEKVRAAVLYDYFWGMKSNADLAERLAYREALLKNWRYLVNYPKRIESITQKETQSLAQKYLVPENRVVLYRVKGKPQ
jgi:predicted Zn-dependent peptidase